jgi:predicted porin
MLVAGIGVAACTAVQAADPLPDSLSLGGVTLYATIDVGYAYQSNGVPLNGKAVGGLEYQAFTTTRNFSGPVSTLAESGLEQSKIGLRVDQPVGHDFNLVGRLETGFNPLSGELTDACGSFVDNAGLPQGKQTANADSSRCGQPFNGQAFGGMSNKTYGTLTIGRQQSLQLDALAVYDPQALSYAFSHLGYSGFNAGAGSTQAARWDNSVKYAYQTGPFHAAVMYSNGGADTGIFGHSYGLDAGVVIAGLSVDGIYEKMNGAVNLRSSFDDAANPEPTPGLAAYASNNESWNLLGRYTFNLGGATSGAGAGGAGTAPTNKLTVFAGYSRIRKAHSGVTSGASQGDYPLSLDININSPAEYNFEWLGAKYAMASGLSLTGAFYHTNQNSWTIGLGPTGTSGIACASAGLLCAGTFSEVSLVADYAFNKHHDVYAGVNYSQVTDGLANGFAGTTSNGNTGSENQTTFMMGYRLRL